MKRRLPLLISFLLFIALCAATAYWALQLFKPPVRPVAAPPREVKADPSVDAAASLFGGRAGKTAVASNYQLRGIIAAGTKDSVAIVSADGKPAQAVRVGTEMNPGVIVKEVTRDHVMISENGVMKRVELPESAKGLPEIASAPPVTARPMPPPPPAQPTARSAVMPPASSLPSPPPATPPQAPLPSSAQQRTVPPSPPPVSPPANQAIPATQQPIVPQPQTAPPNSGVSLPGSVAPGMAVNPAVNPVLPSGVTPPVNTAVPVPPAGMQQALPSQ
ncbi:type II secretion system protein N [Noviherbaspirillum galbum]|uniref:Type II secretion system protein GspC N-terminal domain-containing protein n=1 Tax=Noviherbaspirillum galbum TaxID=2709383 RepID=A0A6B3SKR0_9BURK|nr:type II secretion system protein N [Noviherbaspirillum galbum]NEX61347.1 hypothetical protein [Noviherbaspirillum galbum]